MQEHVDQMLADFVAKSGIPGVVAVATTADGLIYQGAAGVVAAGGDQPMRPDTMLRIASTTKAITTAAVVQLAERGRLSLDDEVASILPEFARIQVLEGWDGDTPRLRPPRTPATVRHLATHTAGLSYEMWNADTLRYQEVTGTPSIFSSQKALLFTPMSFDPGTDWQYGIGIDWLGLIVEELSGQTLPVYLQENFFGPLGMDDTTFTPSAEQRARLTPMHLWGEDGTPIVTDIDLPVDPEFYCGGHALYSTGPDYMKFLQMILAGGKGVLSPESVRVMTENSIGDLVVGPMKSAMPHLTRDVDPFPGMAPRHSVGFVINPEPLPGGRAAGSLSWAGLFNLYYWCDPTTGVAGEVLSQIMPFWDPDVLDLFFAFEREIYASI